MSPSKVVARYHRQQDFLHKVKMVYLSYRPRITANFGLPKECLTL